MKIYSKGGKHAKQSNFFTDEGLKKAIATVEIVSLLSGVSLGVNALLQLDKNKEKNSINNLDTIINTIAYPIIYNNHSKNLF